MKKNIKYWLKKLPVPYNHIAIEEHEKDIAINKRLNIKWTNNKYEASSITEAVAGSFVWAKTEGGYDFWEGIQDNLFHLRVARDGKTRIEQRTAKRYVPRSTGTTAYRNVQKSGMLSAIRLKVYEVLCNSGPLTANELRLKISSTANSGVYSTRLSELERMGAVKTIGRRICTTSGHPALIWAITGNMPKNIVEHNPTRKQKKQKLLLALRTLSSEIKNKTTLKKLTEFYKDLEKL